MLSPEVPWEAELQRIRLLPRVEDQRNLPFLAGADDADRHLLAGPLALDGVEEIVGRLDPLSVHATIRSAAERSTV